MNYMMNMNMIELNDPFKFSKVILSHFQGWCQTQTLEFLLSDAPALDLESPQQSRKCIVNGDLPLDCRQFP